LVPGLGTLAGFGSGVVWGFVMGYLACPYLAPGIKRKFELDQSLSDAELRTAADAMSRYADVKTASDALKLVALVRRDARIVADTPVCAAPAQVARRLLA
jgi:hypothetical protein